MIRALQACLCMALISLPLEESMAAPGSWVANAPAVKVAVAGRTYHSQALQSAQPERLQHQLTQSVRWSYQVEEGRSVQAWLCHSHACLPIAARGWVEIAHSAAAPWYFRFRLPENEARSATVKQLQLIVNYQ